jgi:hypothetical protein
MSAEQGSWEQPGLGLPEPDHPSWQVIDRFPANDLGEQSWAAFERELPHLLETSRGQWVAYSGDQRLGVGPLHTRLYEECVQRGFAPEELVICQIEPVLGQEGVGLGGARVEDCE